MSEEACDLKVLEQLSLKVVEASPDAMVVINENGTIVIADGRIQAVGSNVTVPAGAEVIDATGLSVYPGMMGKLLIKSLDPVKGRNLKAPKNFQPAQSDISGSIIDDFAAQQATVVEKMKATEQLDLERIIISSPVTPVVT